MSTEAASQTYTGGCHCQANRYSVVLSPPLDKKHTVITCNCSICEINGYMLAFTDPGKLTWTEGGPENLKSYTFNKKAITHMFCPNCGTSVAVEGTIGGVTKTGVNARSIDDVDLEGLSFYKYDGKAM